LTPYREISAPTVSVVIPSFNRSAMLREAVESVLVQEGARFELIVVDDGSTDDTRFMLDRLEAPLRIVCQQHCGVSAARNRGIAQSRGEWIAFLDSDDLWRPGKLAAQMRFFVENPHVKICQTEEVWIRDGKRINARKYHEKPEGECFGRLLDRCLVSPSATVVHRSVLEQTGLFDETFPACEDYDLWLRIGWRFAFGLVRRNYVVKRGGHPDQLSATVPALDKYRILSILKLLATAPLAGAQRQRALDVLNVKCRIYAQGCRSRGREEEAEWIESRVRAAGRGPFPLSSIDLAKE
jgi:glycosyltransferase involved in cell wall biosynthesis